MKKVWKIKTNLTQSQNNEFVSKLTTEDQSLMSGLDLDLSVDLLEENTITSFMICNELNLEKIKSLMFKYGVEFEVEDETEFFTGENITVDELTDEYIYNKIGA
jgi:hypothetical protein